MKKFIERTEVAKMAPLSIGNEYAGRYYLPKNAPKDLGELVVKAKIAGYTTDELDLAWLEAGDKKLKSLIPSKADKLDFTEVLEVYFSNLSYYHMIRYEVAYKNFIK